MAAHLGPTPAHSELAVGSPLIDAIEHSPLVRLRKGGGADTQPAQRQLAELAGEIAIPLRYENTLLAVLLVGPPAFGGYGPEELHLLTAFAQVAVLALHGAKGHRTIDHLRQDLQVKVDKISEQQRRIGICKASSCGAESAKLPDAGRAIRASRTAPSRDAPS